MGVGEEERLPQYRNRVKGFLKYCSWDNGQDELIEVPEECPTITTIGINLIEVHLEHEE